MKMKTKQVNKLRCHNCEELIEDGGYLNSGEIYCGTECSDMWDSRY